MQLNSQAELSIQHFGHDKTRIVVIDNFFQQPEAVVELACQQPAFEAVNQDFYPGLRKSASTEYGQQVCQQYADQLSITGDLKQASCIWSAFSITSTRAEKLRPIQMLPHFDSVLATQFAVLIYLFDKPDLGGTGFYRHKQTGFETINQDKLALYGNTLKQQASELAIHKTPAYTCGSNVLFEQIHSVEAVFNRAVIYPSHCLHAANITSADSLSSDPRQGRLTLNNFILFQ